MGKELKLKASRWVTMLCTLFSIAVLGYSESNSYKNVNGNADPYFFRGPESQTVMRGERVVLKCVLAEDNYQFFLTWQQNDAFLPLEDVMREPVNYFQSPDGITMGEYSLTIDSVTRDNAGEYKCVLLNGAGELEKANPGVVLRSPPGSLVVLDPMQTATSTSPSVIYAHAPTFEVAPSPVSIPTPMKEARPGLNDEQEFDEKGSVAIISKSEEELESIEGVPVPVPTPVPTPPVLETASWGWDLLLAYYIVIGMAIALIVFLIIVIALMSGRCCFKCSCPCKATSVPVPVPGLDQPRLNSNFSENDGAHRVEVGASEGEAREAQTTQGGSEAAELFKNQEIRNFHLVQVHPFSDSDYIDDLRYCSLRNPNLYRPRPI